MTQDSTPLIDIELSHNNIDLSQNKKARPKKPNNNNKKQLNSENHETLIAQKSYVSSLEGKINHLENTVNLLKRTLDNQSSSEQVPVSHRAPAVPSDSHCSCSEDTKFRLLENRLHLIENQFRNNL